MVDVGIAGTTCHKDLFSSRSRASCVAPVFQAQWETVLATYWPARSVNGYNQRSRGLATSRLASGT